jgi:lipopolysaccharide transport system ATP-binding protein
MPPVLEVKDLSKKYRLQHNVPIGQTTLVETLANKGRNLFRTLSSPFSTHQALPSVPVEDFWALKDLSFTVEEGDRLGIIGRNGAGKSTLLKIISRIIHPSHGQVKMKGKVSSLLEVGTGFHPELTGRENVYMNGAILGMSRKEINSKFEEIVYFSELEKFIDVPVKRYSSGMFTRLGFAIAANLDPDILILDEVLAVGDFLFQEKCLKKLTELGQQKRTILFVSHDMSSMLALCNKGLYLDAGKLKTFGPIADAVNDYIQNNRIDTLKWEGRYGDDTICFEKIALNNFKSSRDFFCRGEIAKLEIECELLQQQSFSIGFGIWSQRNQLLGYTQTAFNAQNTYRSGKYRLEFPIDTNFFYEGDYIIKVECVRSDSKQVLSDEISLKFPILHPETKLETTSSSRSERGGLCLGTQWQINSF